MSLPERGLKWARLSLPLIRRCRSKKKDRCLKETAFPLAETEDCPCDDFLSQPHGNWSACVLPAPAPPPGALRGWGRYHRRKECGPGLRFKALACVDRSGRLVDPTLCTHSGYETEVCHVPCPLDCKLSAWTAWTACSAPCGGGLKTRSKWLREKAFNGGRPCPKLDMKNQVRLGEVYRRYSQSDTHQAET
ncbi:unnamed protein product [Arctogadus glacialis]